MKLEFFFCCVCYLDVLCFCGNYFIDREQGCFFYYFVIQYQLVVDKMLECLYLLMNDFIDNVELIRLNIFEICYVKFLYNNIL